MKKRDVKDKNASQNSEKRFCVDLDFEFFRGIIYNTSTKVILHSRKISPSYFMSDAKIDAQSLHP